MDHSPSQRAHNFLQQSASTRLGEHCLAEGANDNNLQAANHDMAASSQNEHEYSASTTSNNNNNNNNNNSNMEEEPENTTAATESDVIPAACVLKSKRKRHDKILRESSQWIRELEVVRDRLYRDSVNNAILLDFMAMQGLDEPPADRTGTMMMSLDDVPGAPWTTPTRTTT